MMKKNIVLVLLLAFACFSLAAQETPRAVLSDTWADNFINNWEALNSGIGGLDLESEEIDAAFMRFMQAFAGYLEDASGFAEYRASFAAFRNVKLPPEGEKVFLRYGLGPDCSEAFWVCMVGFMLLALEKDSGQQEIDAAQMTGLRQIIHPDDLAVLDKNYARFLAIFGNI
jgi:hypothetical protein